MKPAVGKNLEAEPAEMGVGSWIIIVVLLLLLAATSILVYFGWTVGDNVALPPSSYIAMALGVALSLGVGFGLMALIFYSSRKGYDKPPMLITPAKGPRKESCRSTNRAASGE